MEFTVGQIINHEVYGMGKVIEVTPRKGPYGSKDSDLVKVEFPEMERELVHEEYIPSNKAKYGHPYIQTTTEKVNWAQFTSVSLEENLVKEDK